MTGSAEKPTITVDIAQAVAQLQASPELATMMMELVAPTAAKDVERLENVCGDLLAALQPFAAVAEHDIGSDEANADLFQVMSERNARAPRLTVGHFRAAYAAFAKAAL